VKSILIFGEPLIFDGIRLSTNIPGYTQLAHMKVSDLIDQSTKAWKTPLNSQLFDQHVTQLILESSLHPPVTTEKLFGMLRRKLTIQCAMLTTSVDSIIDKLTPIYSNISDEVEEKHRSTSHFQSTNQEGVKVKEEEIPRETTLHIFEPKACTKLIPFHLSTSISF